MKESGPIRRVNYGTSNVDAQSHASSKSEGSNKVDYGDSMPRN